MQFNQRLYLLSLLQSSGLQPSSLHLLFNALVINKLTYALHAYAGQLTADDKNRINAISRKAIRRGLTLTAFDADALITRWHGRQRKSMEKWEIRPPLPQKPLNRSSQKFAWVITSETPTPMQNFITTRLPTFGPQICENAHQVTRLVFFWFFPEPTAKTPAPIFTINTSYNAVSRKDVPLGVPKTKFYI